MKKLEPTDLSRDQCPVMKTISTVGDRWILLILRECFLGFKKFDDFHENLGVSKSVLSKKLNTMIKRGLLYKKQYQDEGIRSHFEYRLTGMGWDLIKVVIALMEWGNEHLVDKGETTLDISERDTDHDTKLQLINEKGERTDWYELKLRVIEK
jgi:DNA-binding HxlR family transcriptional regulator